jgi:hypothetical protein
LPLPSALANAAAFPRNFTGVKIAYARYTPGNRCSSRSATPSSGFRHSVH